MPKKEKIQVIEAIKNLDSGLEFSEENDPNNFLFKVQIGKSSEIMTMYYDQLKYCYPQALIDFFESKLDNFKIQKERKNKSM
jgi:hypothetical protein